MNASDGYPPCASCGHEEHEHVFEEHYDAELDDYTGWDTWCKRCGCGRYQEKAA